MIELVDTNLNVAPILDPRIFDTNKNYRSQTGSVFLESNPGLFDSINKTMPTVWNLYKKLKTLDWDENEQDYSKCAVEFETGNPVEIEMLIMTIGWQWETDSLAAHHVLPLLAPFVSNSVVWAAYARIQDNEVLHGLTYSEIVKGSFKNPDEVMGSILGRLEPLKRLKKVTEVMSETMRVGAMINLGQIKRTDPIARDTVMKFIVMLFAMERVQFMISFGVTFAFAECDRFLPIGKIVQKICNDEFNIHAQVGREILRNELGTAIGRESWERIKDEAAEIVYEIGMSEKTFCFEALFAGGRELAGCNGELLWDFGRYCLTDVYNELPGVTNPFGNVTKNPIPYMDEWINLDNNQGAPQEEKTMNYLLGGFVNECDDEVFSVDAIHNLEEARLAIANTAPKKAVWRPERQGRHGAYKEVAEPDRVMIHVR